MFRSVFDGASVNGYGIVTPTQVSRFGAFYPDFLWWVDGASWAIDTTGAHILEAKVRGKLLSIDEPEIALVTIGRISADWHRSETKDGWTLVRASGAIEPKPAILTTCRASSSLGSWTAGSLGRSFA